MFRMNELVYLKGVAYKIVGWYDAIDLPRARLKMNDNGIRGYVYLQRLKGKRTYQGVEYSNGRIVL